MNGRLECKGQRNPSLRRVCLRPLDHLQGPSRPCCAISFGGSCTAVGAWYRGNYSSITIEQLPVSSEPPPSPPSVAPLVCVCVYVCVFVCLFHSWANQT